MVQLTMKLENISSVPRAPRFQVRRTPNSWGPDTIFATCEHHGSTISAYGDGHFPSKHAQRWTVTRGKYTISGLTLAQALAHAETL